MPAIHEVDQESRYICDVCLDEVQEDQGEYACQQHWYCHPCLKDAFERAMQNIDEFPAQCCLDTDMHLKLDDPSLLLSLSLDSEFVQQYKLKLKEHEVPSNDRVHCANTACAKFQDPDDFDKITATNTVQCACGTVTCTSCKAEHLPKHICTSTTRPQLPPYTTDLRVKECPACHQPIELRDACNHVTCHVCRHQFCFICLLQWKQGHLGCPYYGEVAEGHDDEGFERTERGMHVRTGLNRQGMNRLGKHFTDPGRNDTSVDITPRTEHVPMVALEGVELITEELGELQDTAVMIVILRAMFATARQLLAEEGAVPVQPPAPVMPEMPPLPDMLELLQRPGVRDLLETLQFPGMPGMPDMPPVPAMPDDFDSDSDSDSDYTPSEDEPDADMPAMPAVPNMRPPPDMLDMLQLPGMPDMPGRLPLPGLMDMPALLAMLDILPLQEARAMLQNAGDEVQRRQNRLIHHQQILQELGQIRTRVRTLVQTATRQPRQTRQTAAQRAEARVLLDRQWQLVRPIQRRVAQLGVEMMAEVAEAVEIAEAAAGIEG
jgi:uncharacterized protein YaaR (DUF327 family)